MRGKLWGRRLVFVLAVVVIAQLVWVTASFAAPAERPDDWCYGVVVHKGQTLSGIAKRYGVPWQALAAYNHLWNPHYIRAGQCLSIPPKAYYGYYKPAQKYGYYGQYGYYQKYAYGCTWCKSYYSGYAPGRWVWWNGHYVWKKW